MKTVLLTGATSGIGKATAMLFSRHHYRVIINGRSDERGLASVDEFRRDGQLVRFVRADVTKPTEVERLFRTVKEEFGQLDVLVNNAGGPRGRDNFFLAGEGDLIQGFQTNFFSAFLCCQKAAKDMERGAIINVGSVCGSGHNPVGESEEAPIYSASKAALHNLTQNLAKLLAPRIRVNAVIPGYIKTPLWGSGLTASEEARLSKQTRIKRFSTAEEVADVIFLLATNEAMTGSQVIVDGGIGLGV